MGADEQPHRAGHQVGQWSATATWAPGMSSPRPAVAVDVTDPASVERAAAAADGVGIIINNAGIASSTSVRAADTSTLRRELETNLFGPLAVTRAFAGQQLPDGTGAVVTIASVASWIGLAGTYAAVWASPSCRGPR